LRLFIALEPEFSSTQASHIAGSDTEFEVLIAGDVAFDQALRQVHIVLDQALLPREAIMANGEVIELIRHRPQVLTGLVELFNEGHRIIGLTGEDDAVIERIAGNEEALRLNQERNGTRGMARRLINGNGAAANVKHVAFLQRLGVLQIERFRLFGRDTGEHTGKVRRAREADGRAAGRVHLAIHVVADGLVQIGLMHVDVAILEEVGAAGMVEMAMGQQDGDGLIGDALADLADIADTAAGIKQNRTLFANQQVGIDEVELTDAVEVRRDLGDSLLDVRHFTGVSGRGSFSRRFGGLLALRESHTADAHRRSESQCASGGALQECTASDIVAHGKFLPVFSSASIADICVQYRYFQTICKATFCAYCILFV